MASRLTTTLTIGLLAAGLFLAVQSRADAAQPVAVSVVLAERALVQPAQYYYYPRRHYRYYPRRYYYRPHYYRPYYPRYHRRHYYRRYY